MYIREASDRAVRRQNMETVDHGITGCMKYTEERIKKCSRNWD